MDTVKRLYDILDAQHISLYRLTKLSGVGYSTIKTAEKRGGQLTVETIEKVCKALRMSLRDFFTEDGEIGPAAIASDDPLTSEEIAKLREMIRERFGKE